MCWAALAERATEPAMASPGPSAGAISGPRDTHHAAADRRSADKRLNAPRPTFDPADPQRRQVWLAALLHSTCEAPRRPRASFQPPDQRPKASPALR